MIVKVQVPLSSNEEDPPALVYNKDRSVQHGVPVTWELIDALDGKPKAFFYASVRRTRLVLHRKAPWQTW